MTEPRTEAGRAPDAERLAEVLEIAAGMLREQAAAALDVERLAKAILAVDYRMKRPLGWGFALGEAQKLAAAYAAATTDEEGAER